VLVIPLAHAHAEQDQRAEDEHQAHEDLEAEDSHSELLLDSEATVSETTVIELAGMRTAHRSGVIQPA